MRKLVSLILIPLLVLSLFPSCGGKEEGETEPLFTAEEVEMCSPEKHGFDVGLSDRLALDRVTVEYEGRSDEFADLDAGDRSLEPEPGSYLLTLGNFGAWPYADRYGDPTVDGLSFYMPAGENASRVDAVLDKSFPGAAQNVFEVAKGTYGIQIEKIRGDGEREYGFAHPDGYLFVPADPAEYADMGEALNMAVLPSGLRYARISPAEFSLLAALSVLYGGRAEIGQTAVFRAEDPFLPEEYPEYCLCVSSSGAHLDLSYFQAREFLERTLKWRSGEILFTETEANPLDREDLTDLIRIAEYGGREGSLEREYYLTPSGRLLIVRSGEIALSGRLSPDSSDQKTVYVSCLITIAADAGLDYGAVRALLDAAS
ncbi:MAG: hypothetical protein J5849_01595 [Clostridia bacterium]|nr:hypothetical protein [Clostridia bacterium]